MNAQNRTAARRRAGFTLVELMIVVVILGILAGVVSRIGGQTSEQSLELADIQVQDAIGRAQALARSNRQAFGVVFDLATDRFAIVDETGALAVDPLTRRDYVVRFGVPNQPSLIDVKAADFGATGVAIVFDPQGVPIAGGNVTLAHGTATRQISVDAATGQITSL